MVPENFRLICSINCPAPWRKTSTKRVVNVFDRKCDQKWMLSSLMWLLRHKTWFLCLRDFFSLYGNIANLKALAANCGWKTGNFTAMWSVTCFLKHEKHQPQKQQSSCSCTHTHTVKKCKTNMPKTKKNMRATLSILQNQRALFICWNRMCLAIHWCKLVILNEGKPKTISNKEKTKYATASINCQSNCKSISISM